MKFNEIKESLNISEDSVINIRSKPLNRGVIRVDYFKVGRTFYINDCSDNSSGLHRVIGERSKKLVLNSIEKAA